MKRISLLLLVVTATAISVTAQKRLSTQPSYVEWADNPTLHAVPPEYKNEHAFFILKEESLDYRVEDGYINVYSTSHWIVKVLDDIGIDNFNANGISVNRGTRVPSIKARTIRADGKVMDITRDMIKVTQDEYGRNKIIFAMEGVEKNAEIEVLVKQIRRGVFGSDVFQYQIPIRHARFEMSYPKDLVFEERSFNGFPDGHDTLIGNRRHIAITKSDIPGLKREAYSLYDLHRMRCEYRLARFVEPNQNDPKKLNTWEDFGKELYNDHIKISDQEKAVANKFLSDLGVAGEGASEADNIRKIENGIKNNIVLYPFVNYEEREQVYAYNDFRSVSTLAAGYDERKNVLDSIVSKKAASEEGYVKLFAACFAQAGVKFELGMTTNREEHGFDSKFENWGNMYNYVFYFPGTNKFLSPTDIYCRYPVVAQDVLGNKGVFSTIPPSGAITGSMSDIRTINPLPASESQNNTTAEISFTKDMEATAEVTYSWTGYNATDIRASISAWPRDKMKDLVKKLLPLADAQEDIVNYKILHETFDNAYTNKPLELTATIKTPQLTEQAGKDYLFKLGALIQDQAELYTEEDRKTPVDLGYPSMSVRRITVNIPKGYKIMNPNAIKMHADYVDEKMKPVLSFNADYSIVTDKKNGDKLIVTVTESYTQIHYSVADYQRFRKIFNTSADFNKVTLLLARKNGA